MVVISDVDAAMSVLRHAAMAPIIHGIVNGEKTMLDPKDLEIVVTIARLGSFAKAARALDITVPAVSKRLSQFETKLGLRMFDRTTRRVVATSDGETIVTEARVVLERMSDLEALAMRAQRAPAGNLRINSSLGFGRRFLAPLLSEFAREYPDVTIDLTLTQGLPVGPEIPFDLAIRVGEPVEQGLIAKRLATNQRMLAASPRYLKRAGVPRTLADLLKHRCLVVRETVGDFATWTLQGPHGEETVRVPAHLASNDGESVVAWAVDEHGVLMRSFWDLAPHLASKKLVRVLPDYSRVADVHALYHSRRFIPPRVTSLMEFLRARLPARM
jgi:LysR family transcriptional regulator, transcriptional activator for dmlA